MQVVWEDDSPYERRSIQSGMRVRAGDGQVLGRVAFIGRERLYLRRQRFARVDHWRAVPLTRVERLLGGDVIVQGADTEPVSLEAFHADVPTATYPLAEASEEAQPVE
ncbi:PRC-barrel domain containing protein [Myxococcaceae bacterium GXIMD 01537]